MDASTCPLISEIDKELIERKMYVMILFTTLNRTLPQMDAAVLIH